MLSIRVGVDVVVAGAHNLRLESWFEALCSLKNTFGERLMRS
jgi:hypothetical protein